MTDRLARYGPTARVLHWLGVAFVVILIPAGVIMTQGGLPRDLQNTLFILHKNLGVAAITLIAVRLIWRSWHGAPAFPASLPMWQKQAARISHGALYVLLVILPVSGYLRVRAGGFPIEMLDAMGIGTLVPQSETLETAAQTVHWAAGLVLMGLIAVHVGAALLHALRNDGVMRRIWPPLGRRDAA